MGGDRRRNCFGEEKEEALIVIRLACHASPRFTVHKDRALGVLLKMKVLREGGR